MARDGLAVLLCAGLVLGALPRVAAAPGADPGGRLRDQLAVQAALEQGLEHLQRGHYKAAVDALEGQIARIDGNHRYLTALRDAYRGHVRELRGAGRDAEAQTYLKRLEILDPAARAGRPDAPPTPAPAAKAPAPAPARTPRGKIEDDPFAEANRAAAPAKALVERAEQAFAAAKYEDAQRLYEQASRADAAATAACAERWAYCKLYVVAQALRGPAAPAADLEKEVRVALALAPSLPKLEAFGNKLLGEIKSRSDASAAPVEVKHTPRKGDSRAVAETANFRIFHTQSKEAAERVARVAEATRVRMTRLWFGEAPAPWSPRCDVHLHATAADYTKATGHPAQSPGHSTISLDPPTGRVVTRRIDLRCDDPNLFEGVLPHETTHVVLGGRFGKHHVPRWADEGMAVLSEPQARINLHLRNLPAHKRDGILFEVGRLMQMSDYPQPRYIGPFYAQGVSLVDFLTKKKDHPTFVRFLRDGLDGGYEPALRKHYNVRSFAELDAQWRRHALGDGGDSVAEKRR